MKTTNSSITQTIADTHTEDVLLTYDEAERQENEINRENAKLVFNWHFLVTPREVFSDFKLSGNDAIIYGFIISFVSGQQRFYFTNEQLSSMFNLSERSVTQILSRLKDAGLINLSYRRKADGGQIRFIQAPTSRKFQYQLAKNASSNSQKMLGNEDKINEDKINNITNVIEKPSVSLRFGNTEINEVQAYFLTALDLPREDCSTRQSRQYWNLLLKESKTGVTGVRWLIDQVRDDPFYRSNITSSRDLYYKRVKIVARKRGGVMKHYDGTAEIERRRVARLDRPKGDPLVTG